MDDILRQQLDEIIADLRRGGQGVHAARLLMYIEQSDRRAHDAMKKRCDDLLARAAVARSAVTA